MKAYMVVFLSVFLAELGDKTQLATVLFASNAALSLWGVLAAAAGALVAYTALAVVVGALLVSWVEGRHVQRVAGLGFIAIGAWMLVRG